MKAQFLCSLISLLTFTTSAAVPDKQSIPDTIEVAQLADTTAQKDSPSRASIVVRKAVAPVTLIGLGVTHMDRGGFFEGSVGLRRVVRRHYTDFSTSLDDYVYYGPVVMAAGLNIGGVEGQYQFAEQALLLGMTHFVNRILTNNLKSITAIDRPDGSNNDAFPSGHTSKAFAYATFFHKEYGPRSVWYSIAGYSFATATGAMRILNDRHWLSDVLTGAGIGILSAELVYLAYPYMQKKIAQSFLKKQQVAVLPFYGNGAGGIALVYRIR